MGRANWLSGKEFLAVSSSYIDEVRHIVIDFVSLSLHGSHSVRMLGDKRIITHINFQP